MIKMDLPRQKSATYKIRMKHAGGHVHLRFFSKYTGSATWAGIGELVIADDEVTSFLSGLLSSHFLEEEDS